MTIAEWCPSVARTFLSALDHAGRQSCLPHTILYTIFPRSRHRCRQNFPLSCLPDSKTGSIRAYSRHSASIRGSHLPRSPFCAYGMPCAY